MCLCNEQQVQGPALLLGPEFEGLIFQLLKTAAGIGVSGVEGLQVSRAPPTSVCRVHPAGFCSKPLGVLSAGAAGGCLHVPT